MAEHTGNKKRDEMMMERDVKRSIKSILAATLSIFTIVFSLIKLVLHFSPHIVIDNSTKMYNNVSESPQETVDSLRSKPQPIEKHHDKKTNDTLTVVEDFVQQPPNTNRPISKLNLPKKQKTIPQNETTEKQPKKESSSLVDAIYTKEDNAEVAKDPIVVTEELTKIRDNLEEKFQEKTNNNKGDKTQKEPLNRHKEKIKEDKIKKDKKDAFEILDKEFDD